MLSRAPPCAGRVRKRSSDSVVGGAGRVLGRLEGAGGATATRTARFLAGFGIDEIQVAFNTLEEALWRFLVATVPPEELSDDLGQLGAVLGAGKDQLAQTYVLLASRRHAPHVDVEVLNQIS